MGGSFFQWFNKNKKIQSLTLPYCYVCWENTLKKNSGQPVESKGCHIAIFLFLLQGTHFGPIILYSKIVVI